MRCSRAGFAPRTSGPPRRSRRSHSWATLLVLLVEILSPARQAGAAAERRALPAASASAIRSLLDSPRRPGDLGGQRSRLEQLGIDLQLSCSQYVGWRARGGVDPDRRFGSSGGYDFFGLVDVEELAGWRGADFLLHVKGQYDENLNEDVGALSSRSSPPPRSS
jgi:carbohydrate-selective porin OprB